MMARTDENAASGCPADAGKAKRPIRVMIVDDSAAIRMVLEKTLKRNPGIEVVGFAANGELALQSLPVCNPDIIILDIEMPVMDGLTALPLLLKKKPGVKILICSTLSERGADVSIKALSLGAADYILKPSGPEAIRQSTDFHDGLIRMVLGIGGALLQAAAMARPAAQVRKLEAGSFRPKIVMIGSSTGGPAALTEFLRGLNNLPVPIVIAQHMPKTFTTMLAKHIEQTLGIVCHEGMEGEIVSPGAVYIAPGGYHMRLKRKGNGVMVALDEGPMEHFCRPAVDPLFRSGVEAYGPDALAIVLTGMGVDGLAGCQDVVKAGGRVIAQDQASSIVWGMPGAVANAGLCSMIGPVSGIAETVSGIFKNG